MKKGVLVFALLTAIIGSFLIYRHFRGTPQAPKTVSTEETKSLLREQHDYFQKKGAQGVREKQYAPVIETLKRMLVKYPDNIPLKQKLAFAYFASGHYDDAEPLLREVVDHNLADAETYYELGFIAKEKGEQDESARLVKKALELNPKHQGAMELSK
ncbi:MAG: tetratricopeptide repeat protein [Deltaproteobacteria bacterium]|nr:tetratricopeptide repeat protein [Deltaproteobacteria bacterium]